MFAVSFLIVGQGLAGSLLAWELLQRQQTIAIIDPDEENASKVAAGLINPVTGMRFVADPRIADYLSVARHLYQSLEHHFKQRFLIERPMLRILKTVEHRQLAEKRLQDTAYASYLDGILEASECVESPYGLLRQKQTGYIKTRDLLLALQQYFMQRGVLQKRRLDYAQLEVNGHVRYQEISAKKIIFCEGYAGQHNPWFSCLPFTPVKGEILTATSTTQLPQEILNYHQWMIPTASDQFRTGSSFDRDNINLTATEDARQMLLAALNKVLKISPQTEVINQQVGIRAATQDRQPFIGTHPAHSSLSIFNGFGSKGSLFIPYYCRHFADHLLNARPLLEMCNITRFS